MKVRVRIELSEKCKYLQLVKKVVWCGEDFNFFMVHRKDYIRSFNTEQKFLQIVSIFLALHSITFEKAESFILFEKKICKCIHFLHPLLGNFFRYFVDYFATASRTTAKKKA